jgi:hypothetical protein
METTKTIYQLHEDHKIWLNKLAFYEDEILIMKKRIAELAKKNTSKEILSFIEHFQNQLIVQKEQIDILKHDINSHEKYIEEMANKKSVADGTKKLEDHPSHNERIETFEKLFNDLRKELIHFIAKWM